VNEHDPIDEPQPQPEVTDLPPAWRIDAAPPAPGAWDEITPSASPPPGSRATSRKTWLIGAAGAAVIAIGAFVGLGGAGTKSSSGAAATGAQAQAGPGGAGGFGRPGTTGTIASISGSTLTVKTTSGTTKVTTSTKTTVSETSTASLSAVKVGDHVQVMGATSGTNTVAAERIVTGTAATTGGMGRPPTMQGGTPPAGMAGGSSSGASGNAGPAQGGPGGFGGFVSGVVTASGNGTLTVKEASGTVVTVTTSSSTVVVKRTTSSVSALKVGEQVSVRGTTSNGAVVATTIDEGATADAGFPGGAPSGAPSGAPAN